MTNITKLFLAVLGFTALFAAAASAETQVTVENDKVTVNSQDAASAPAATVVKPVIVEERDPRRIEGEIISVDVGHGLRAEGEITIRDIDGREKRVLLKPGMISQYKVGDYVEVYLMADMKEAKEIHTRRTADIEGEIVTVDYATNVVVIRDSRGSNRTVLFRPGLISEHKVGDRVRLYVTDAPITEPVRLIRVQ